MSDTPQSPDWWQASDGKWYPPQTHAGGPSALPPPVVVIEQRKRRGCLTPFFLPSLLVLGAIVMIAVIAAVVAGDDDDDDCEAGDGVNDTRNLCLYPERADRKGDDHEAQLGDGVRLAGYTATVEEAFLDEERLGTQNLVIRVTVENRDSSSQSYNELFDWDILTPSGQILSPTIINLRDDSLGSGSLAGGGRATGTVAFDVDPGAYFVIYQPDPFNKARGVWLVEAD